MMSFTQYILEADNFSIPFDKFLGSMPKEVQDKLKNVKLPEPNRFFGALKPSAKNLTGEVKTSALNVQQLANDFGVTIEKSKIDVIFSDYKLRFIISGKTSTGKSLAAADWEKVIVVAHNMYNHKLTLEDAIKEGDVSSFDKDLVELVDIGIEIIKSAKIKGPIMKHYGASSADLTKEWDKYFFDMTGKHATAATKTPKTDMYLINNTNISLKKEGGSQLMSGGQAETMATLMFSYNEMSNKAKDKLFKSTFDSLISNVSDHFSKINDVSINNIKKQIDKGETSELIDVVKSQLDKNDEMRNAIRKLTDNNEFKNAMVYEAMTGNNKFSTELARSTHIMVFNELGKSKLTKIDKSVVTNYASKTSFDISFKSARNTSWVALKGIVKESTDDFLLRTLNETIDEAYLLNEGFVSYLKKGVSNVKKFISSIITKWFGKIFNIVKESFSSLIAFANTEIQVKTPDIQFKI